MLLDVLEARSFEQAYEAIQDYVPAEDVKEPSGAMVSEVQEMIEADFMKRKAKRET